MKPHKRSKGFTLIELLVVIAIIGLLSTIVLFAVDQARVKARDSKRVQDLVQLRTALELYHNDVGHYESSDVDHGYYSETGYWAGMCISNGEWTYESSGSEGWIPNLAPKYISVLPDDPLGANGNCYLYRSDGTDYKIKASAETPPASNSAFYNQTCPSEPDDCNTFQISTGGAVDW